MSVQFSLHENVVYPSHGVATIMRIVEKIISGNRTILYELRFLHKEMTILVPTNNLIAIGIRPLSSREKIVGILRFLAQPGSEWYHVDVITASNWKHRNKEYQSKLRRGGLDDIASIYRELKYLEQTKELSFCEKNLLLQTELLLAEEIALVMKLSEEQIVEQLRSLFGSHQPLHSPKQSIKVVHAL